MRVTLVTVRIAIVDMLIYEDDIDDVLDDGFADDATYTQLKDWSPQIEAKV